MPEQDELFCCIIISSGLKEKKKKVFCDYAKECRNKKKVCPFLLLKSLDPLFPLGNPRLLINLPENGLSDSKITPFSFLFNHWPNLGSPTRHYANN